MSNEFCLEVFFPTRLPSVAEGQAERTESRFCGGSATDRLRSCRTPLVHISTTRSTRRLGAQRWPAARRKKATRLSSQANRKTRRRSGRVGRVWLAEPASRSANCEFQFPSLPPPLLLCHVCARHFAPSWSIFDVSICAAAFIHKVGYLRPMKLPMPWSMERGKILFAPPHALRSASRAGVAVADRNSSLHHQNPPSANQARMPLTDTMALQTDRRWRRHDSLRALQGLESGMRHRLQQSRRTAREETHARARGLWLYSCGQEAVDVYCWGWVCAE